MNLYKRIGDKVEIITDRGYVKTALEDFGAVLVLSRQQSSIQNRPVFTRKGHQIVSNSPERIASVVSVFSLPLEQLDALNAILLDLGVVLEELRA